MKRKKKDGLIAILIYMAAGVTVAILGLIIGFVVMKGLPGISFDFLTNQFDDKTTYVTAELNNQTKGEHSDSRAERLGVELKFDKELGIVAKKVDADSPLKHAVDGTGEQYGVKAGDVIQKIGSYDADREMKKLLKAGQSAKIIKEKAAAIAETKKDTIRLKIMRPGGGIVPMAVTTLYMILLSLLIAGPVGILAAVYLNEYGKQGKLMKLIHFAIQNLVGIPSIIYGLFGSLFFVQICQMKYSLLAGALTVSIILLPTIISTTEESLKTVPKTYRESSLGLGATKLQTTLKVVLPNAISGILVAVLLSIGRVAGESAALLLTAGTIAQIPQALYGNSASGATLTIKAYTLMKEQNDLTTACAIGIVLLVLIFGVNAASKLIVKKMQKIN